MVHEGRSCLACEPGHTSAVPEEATVPLSPVPDRTVSFPSPVSRRLARAAAALAAVLAAVVTAVLVAVTPASAATLTQVTSFGSNPGNLSMYVYRPDGVGA